MSAEDKKYLKLLVAHALLGYLAYAFFTFAKFYALAILVYGIYAIIRSRNDNNEALYASAYIVGAEILLRVIGVSLLYEYGKYSVVLFLLIGIYFQGFSKNGIPYWIFLLLLVPGVIIATQTLGPETEMRKTISFNLSGPICLGIASLYCYQRKVTQQVVFDTLMWLGLPVLSMTVFLVFKTPDLREAITGTSSNFATSGGFGPNQVATMLGIGIFIFFSRVMFNSKSKLMLLVNIVALLNVAFRGLITFSRGGIITGLVIVVILMAVTYLRVNSTGKSKLKILLIVGASAFFSIWVYSSVITNGLIDKRYSNKDAAGREKESHFSGREELAALEIKDFMENPIFGIGVAKGSELRRTSGLDVVSHNEITRMLAEHGTLGIMGLLILFFTPLVNYLDNRDHVFLLSFLIFWLLTINHAAMRLAAPAFVYSLSLLKIVGYEKTPSVHRE